MSHYTLISPHNVTPPRRRKESELLGKELHVVGNNKVVPTYHQSASQHKGYTCALPLPHARPRARLEPGTVRRRWGWISLRHPAHSRNSLVLPEAQNLARATHSEQDTDIPSLPDTRRYTPSQGVQARAPLTRVPAHTRIPGVLWPEVLK